KVHRCLSWRHHCCNDPCQRAILERGKLQSTCPRRVEWLDICRHDISLLPLHRGCVAHALDCGAHSTRRGPLPSDFARSPKIGADVRVRSSNRLLAHSLPRVPLRWPSGASAAHRRPAKNCRLLPCGLYYLLSDWSAWHRSRNLWLKCSASRPPLFLPSAW